MTNLTKNHVEALDETELYNLDQMEIGLDVNLILNNKQRFPFSKEPITNHLDWNDLDWYYIFYVIRVSPRFHTSCC